jgi:hypothetical protein
MANRVIVFNFQAPRVLLANLHVPTARDFAKTYLLWPTLFLAASIAIVYSVEKTVNPLTCIPVGLLFVVANLALRQLANACGAIQFFRELGRLFLVMQLYLIYKNIVNSPVPFFEVMKNEFISGPTTCVADMNPAYFVPVFTSIVGKLSSLACFAQLTHMMMGTLGIRIEMEDPPMEDLLNLIFGIMWMFCTTRQLNNALGCIIILNFLYGAIINDSLDPTAGGKLAFFRNTDPDDYKKNIFYKLTIGACKCTVILMIYWVLLDGTYNDRYPLYMHLATTYTPLLRHVSTFWDFCGQLVDPFVYAFSYVWACIPFTAISERIMPVFDYVFDKMQAVFFNVNAPIDVGTPPPP